MKLEEGMYVRTKDGDMFILDKIEDNHLIPRYVHIPYIITEKDVIKASHSLLGNDKESCLIEVGDYVNGYKVYSGGKKDFDYILTWDDVEKYYMKIPLHTVNFKSIVTKEQFSQMEYKVGDL